jgi:2-polyprenyl-6-methoxyphenol hydroxylase-like FAD-dependent oxidoreductase
MRVIDVPVLIAGGGPVGMTLALELARYGVRSVLVERNPATTRFPKMDLTNGRAMELFRRLGLHERLREVGVPRDNCFDIAWITSLAGYELHRFHYPSATNAMSLIQERNDGSQAREAPLRVSQVVIEPVLKAATEAHPLIDVRFGVAFETLISAGAERVESTLHDEATGERTSVVSRYLAACDGGASTVRTALGIELDGKFGVASAYMVHFRSRDHALLQRWGIAWHYQSASGSMIAQNDEDIWTLQAWIPPGVDPATMDPGRVLETWAGRRFDYEILLANPWQAHFVVAQSFARGRVALAGDAAHQFVPTGGYGMNSGIADAAGLGWMLAAQLQGWGGPRLLEAHDRERRPTAWWHLRASQRHVKVRGEIAQVYLAAGDLEGSDVEGEARRRRAGAAIAALGNAENESWGVELGYRYDDSPIIVTEPDPPPVDPLVYAPSTWPGARLPHVFLPDGSSVHDRLGRYFTLLALDSIDAAPIAAAAAARRVPLEVVALHEPALRAIYARDYLLVRPDQHVCWRGDELPSDFDALLARVSGW